MGETNPKDLSAMLSIISSEFNAFSDKFGRNAAVPITRAELSRDEWLVPLMPSGKSDANKPAECRRLRTESRGLF